MSEELKRVDKGEGKKSKRLITAGIFIAVYFIIFAVIGSVCMPIPILYILMPIFIAFFSAPVFMLMLAKAPIKGPVFIAGVLPGAFLLAMGNIWVVIVTAVVCGLAADIVAGIGKYKNWTLNTISYVIFTENILGGFLPIWIMREMYFKSSYDRGMSQEFCDTVRSLTPIWVLFVMIAGTVIASVLGVLFSKKLFKKHFEKANIL